MQVIKLSAVFCFLCAPFICNMLKKYKFLSLRKRTMNEKRMFLSVYFYTNVNIKRTYVIVPYIIICRVVTLSLLKLQLYLLVCNYLCKIICQPV